jgi:hypothetical protein
MAKRCNSNGHVWEGSIRTGTVAGTDYEGVCLTIEDYMLIILYDEWKASTNLISLCRWSRLG